VERLIELIECENSEITEFTSTPRIEKEQPVPRLELAVDLDQNTAKDAQKT
jgi:hypothetical protein